MPAAKYYKYSTITSADIKRTFFAIKPILLDKDKYLEYISVYYVKNDTQWDENL